MNRYVKGGEGENAEDILHAFARWPTWMWANREVAQLVRWLRAHNDRALDERKVGFYGLDVYSLWESMDAVIEYLQRVDPAAVAGARRAYSCFEPYNEDAQEYARATALVPTSCQAEASRLWSRCARGPTNTARRLRAATNISTPSRTRSSRRMRSCTIARWSEAGRRHGTCAIIT